ncbi:MAG: cell division ATPase MinD [Candidatus Aenigmarchaeota archaeon]|nr:cell division ATPase MinD [Candidatus Pacearchaeota archaeon]MCX8191138.1 cell division ATPase MinD [Candidatus Aenigmarchaeota archaeon]
MVVIGVISAKGGVGKTTVTSNLSSALVKFFGKKVLAVDGNITTPNLGIHFGMLSQENTLNEVLEDKIEVTQAIYIHPSGVHILPASLSATVEYPDVMKLKEKIDEVKDNYDYVIIDGAAGIGREVLATIKASDKILLVSNPDMAAVVSMIKARKIVQILNTYLYGLILNRVEGKKYEMKKERIEELSEVRIIGEIPFDKKIIESISKMVPLVLLDGRARASRVFKKIAAEISQEVFIEKESIWDKIIRFLRLRKI